MTDRKSGRAISSVSIAEHCFVCGNKLLGFAVLMTETATLHLGVDLPVKIGQVVGKDFFIIVSNEDKICKHCLNLINELDECENNVITAKKKVLNLLEKKYGIHAVQYYDSTYNYLDPHASLDAPSHFDVSQNTIINDDNNSKSDKKLDTCSFNNKILQNNIHNNKNCFGPDSCIKSEQCQNERTSNVVRTTEITLSAKSTVFKENTEETESKVTEYIDPQTFRNEHDDFHCLQKEGQKEQKKIPIEESKILQFGVNGLCKEIKKEPRNENEHLEPINKNIAPSDVLNTEQCTSIKETGQHFKHCEHKLCLKNKKGENISEENSICHVCKLEYENVNFFFTNKQCTQKNKCTLCNVKGMNGCRTRENNKEVCNECDIQFDTSKALKRHRVEFHQTKHNSTCRICGKIFKKQIQLENHVKYFHGSKKCKICGKYIEDEVKLRQHVQRHIRLDSKKLDCDVCGRNFKTPSGLRVHKVSHTGNYKFFCEFCGRGFMSAVIMDEHIGVHTKEEKYMCDMCGRKFVHYSTFHLHVQWHKDPFPFPCKVCDKKFKYRSERSNHVRRDHTGDYPYKCNYCTAKFLKLVYLKRHMMNHTQEYPHMCETCNKGFDQKRSLARHRACIHKDNSLLNTPKQCEYKIILRPDEYDFSWKK